MIRTLGGRIATREERQRFSVSTVDLGPCDPMACEDCGSHECAGGAACALTNEQYRPVPPLCRECQRHPVNRNYGHYCSRACLKAADL